MHRTLIGSAGPGMAVLALGLLAIGLMKLDPDLTRPIFCTNSSESLHHSLGP